MTLIKDLIPIPEQVQRGDFVLNLASGVEQAEQTLRDYVVTPQLARCFDDALGFIKSAVTPTHNRNKGAYLHGSFGSGKSHFMAVLHLLLQGNMAARAITELGGAVRKHDDWMQSKNCLLVPYHMIGAESVEAGVLGGYARHIRKLHPEAPVPGFYLSGRLFDNARQLRAQMGDEAFFAGLRRSVSGGADGWGDVESGWDAADFDAVVAGRVAKEDRDHLVGDLVASYFSSFQDLANTTQGGYLEFDEGLAVLCRHAKDLGYDAVILFLDELILWLASRLSDPDFIHTAIQKVVKLVETGIPRSLPMVSFIARQRDLREFVGDQLTGAGQVVLSDSLKYWEGRFHTITLEDRNLPVIAQKRLLQPRDAAARQALEDAFSQTERMREEAFAVLLTSQGDREMFLQVYPFSPALMQALVALSSALQRERTALKVMLMLLVSQRDRLTLGQLIPVGDLYDVIASEAEPFSEQMRTHFDNARNLLERKLVPVLEREHGVIARELETLGESDPAKRNFLNDLRLLKTLLLAALAPEVEALKQLTAGKLAALNHGTIRAPIPGREAQTVLTKCRKWAGQVGEIKISDDQNPVIGVQLSGVDTENIIEQARIVDNPGNRRRMIRELVFDAFGIEDSNQLFVDHELLWRGTRRRVEVLFQNIREITDMTTFEARGDDWKLIVDFPFDEGNHSPSDDRARIQDFEDEGRQSRTLCWLPYFFSREAQASLAKLVILEDILKSDERYNGYSRHLTAVDKQAARTLLENQRSQLRQQIRNYLEGAYGVSAGIPGSLDDSVELESQVRSLDPSFTPRLPVGASMKHAFHQLVGQALAHQFPEHPEFETEVRLGELGKVFEVLRRAVHTEHGRVDVDQPLRQSLRQIAQPLGLGTMHERHFLYSDDWFRHFQRELATGTGSVTVQRLREITDRPQPRGLPDHIQNLLIMVFAEHGQYAFTLHGGLVDPTLKDINDDLVLVRQEMADPQDWQQALRHAAELFGDNLPNQMRTANNQKLLQDRVTKAVADSREPSRDLRQALHDRLGQLRLSTSCQRMANADLAVQVLDGLQGKEGAELVKALAAVTAHSSMAALGSSIAGAAAVARALGEDTNWRLLESAWGGGSAEGVAIRNRVCEALQADNLVTSLPEALKRAEREATDVVTGPKKTPVPPPPEPPQPPPPPPGKVVVKSGARHGVSAAEAKTLLTEIQTALGDGAGKTLNLTYEILSEATGP